MVIMILLLSFMPNSPRFLLSRSRDAEALQALSWLRGADADIRWEFQQIRDNVQRQVRVVQVPSQPASLWCPHPACLSFLCFSRKMGCQQLLLQGVMAPDPTARAPCAGCRGIQTY